MNESHLAVIFGSQPNLLYRIGKTLSSTNFDLEVAFGGDCSKRDVLESSTVRGNLPIAIRIFSLAVQLKSNLDRTLKHTLLDP